MQTKKHYGSLWASWVGVVLEELPEPWLQERRRGLMGAAQHVFGQILALAGNQYPRKFQFGLELSSKYGATSSTVMNSRLLPKQVALLMLGMLLAAPLTSQQSGPVAWWKFDERGGMIATDNVGGQQDQIS